MPESTPIRLRGVPDHHCPVWEAFLITRAVNLVAGEPVFSITFEAFLAAAGWHRCDQDHLCGGSRSIRPDSLDETAAGLILCQNGQNGQTTRVTAATGSAR